MTNTDFKHLDRVRIIAPRYSCVDTNGDDIDFAVVWNVPSVERDFYEVMPIKTHDEPLSADFIPESRRLVKAMAEWLFKPKQATPQ